MSNMGAAGLLVWPLPFSIDEGYDEVRLAGLLVRPLLFCAGAGELFLILA